MSTTVLFLLRCLLIGLFFSGRSLASTVVDYQDDEYDYGEDDNSNGDTANIPVSADFEISRSPPYFDQTEMTLNAKPGDDVIINCDVRNFQINNVVVWYKNSKIIVNGQNAINNRVESMKNNSILIRNVTSQDADDYYCEILPQNVRQHTKLQVGGLLSIFCDGRDVTGRSQTFKQGDHHILECRTYLPTETNIKWSFNGKRLDSPTSDSDNGVIVLENVDEDSIGVYQCLGDDGTKKPPHGMVTIDVHYSPKVSTHRHHVNAQAGGTAELYCDYKAHPIAISFWRKGSDKLDLSEKYIIENSVHKRHNRTTLIVKNIDDEDIDKYSCIAENSVGLNQAIVQLSYHPETPQFENITIDGNKVTLHWLVRSLQPLSEAILDYKLSGSYTWSTVSVIHSQRHGETSGIWKISHQMVLRPGNWHARVKTKNTKGWSSFSADYDFMIEAKEDSNQVSDSDIPPDDLVRAGFGGGGTSGSAGINNGPTILAGAALAIGFISVQLRH